MIDSVERMSQSQVDSPEFPGDLTNSSAGSSTGEMEVKRSRLLSRILRRIESRLPGRIRQLSVNAAENAIVLTGCCSTYYTKQLAQHTAMGVLEYERLINNIDVNSPK
jgi:hypothetical protein